MVLSFSRPSRIFIMVCLTLVFFLAPGLFRQGSTKAQTFIERILKQDAQKAKKYKKRTVQKRSSKRLLAKQAEKPAPATKYRSQIETNNSCSRSGACAAPY